MEEIKLSMSGITDENESVISEDCNFIISLNNMDYTQKNCEEYLRSLYQ